MGVRVRHELKSANSNYRATDDEQPRAYVVRKPTSRISEQDVVDFVKKNVSTIKHLTGGVAFLESIPKTPVSEACFVDREFH